jgi:hypothetical protein
MKIIPTVIGGASRAEFLIFGKIKKSKIPGFAFHSLLLSEHQINPTGEADFVIVSPKGLIVIEVKGGGVRRDADGWAFAGRHGVTREVRGPFQQATQALWSLVKLLKRENVGHQLDRISFGHAVAFPQCEFSEQSVEWDRTYIWDAERETSESFDDWLDGVFSHWQNQSGKGLANGDCVAALAGAMRPFFNLVQTLASRVDEVEHNMHQLTEEQLSRLEILELEERVICLGGAGTGKTVLAVEAARLLAADHNRVVFTCQNPVLASFLRSRLEDEKGVEVIPFAELDGLRRPAEVLIIDEAQDVLDSDGLATVDRAVEGGLQGGRWRIFLDPNAQAAFSKRYDPGVLAQLQQHGVTALLSVNCRNTSDVVMNIQLMTGADVGVATLGPGPGVDTVAYRSVAEAAALAEEKLRALLNGGVSPSDISLLSPLSFEESTFAHLPADLTDRIVILDTRTASDWPLDELSFATIEDFKGFENRFLLISDLDDVTSGPQAAATLYVGMSRARISLWLAMTESAREQLEPVISRHARELNEGDGAA